ncbi:CaiB/BaiF CoA-transferase family protein [Amycolatopsis sp.]|uniref:CaiB/BaiF CoA transferase family protein n=1 Tax=Amycolatopsis sp. TaxID=37632 RepID=UPI002B5F0993|nr:CaiB/BaiF CoA-transferase family protein [Amycolatopsis sp.]HVV08190.1 CaiB/BaiF CoA-transferase family protein [Amycolatopsis sp.]
MGTTGPLSGLRVLELAGLGSVAMAAMTLADLGADVVRLDRPGGPYPASDDDPVLRGRRHVRVDLKTAEGRAAALDLAASADVLLESLRPGVAERLGVGPEDCLARNPRLVYARVTGWGQDGPLAHLGGHDLNYVALTGVLRAIGRADERPAPPLNVLGFAGGAIFGVVGVLAALREAERSGRGQVVDAAIVDGVGLLAQMVWSFRERGQWTEERESNLFDGHAPFYDTYRCADGEFIAVGAMEPVFYANLLDGLGLAAEDLPAQLDEKGWPVLRARFTEVFAQRTRDEWAAAFDGRDACVTPVLTFSEAAGHPHVAARSGIVTRDGVQQAAPAPRFSRTTTSAAPARAQGSLADVLADWRDR